MRNEVSAGGSTLTVGELRAALEGVDDGASVFLVDAYAGEWNVYAADGSDLQVAIKTEARFFEPGDAGREEP